MKKYFLIIMIFTGTAQCAVPVYADDIRTGTTFSQVQCEYLDMDWKDVYLEVLGMNFDIIRLAAYWNRIEKEQGVYDFRELDWQIEKAEEKSVKILLTVGMKAPRWPEYFIPAWVMSKTKVRPGANVANNKTIREDTLSFIEAVIRRYRDKDIIIAWQIENEPFNRSGPKNWWISKDFLMEEMDLVKKSDVKNRPIIINALSLPNAFLRFFSKLVYSKNPILETIDFAETPAVNVYARTGHKLWNSKICFITRPKERIRYLKQLIEYARRRNKSLWITELQAEPWDPGELVHLKEEESITCWPASFSIAFMELRSLEIGTIFLWGAEYWVYRVKAYNDHVWLNAALKLRGSHP